jgi:spore coat protein CotF
MIQLEEKTMVADTLTGINGELLRYAEMIPQTENKELKQCLKQLRTACEKSQEEIYQIARAKSYYIPAAAASKKEIDHVRNLFTSGTI